MKPVVLPPNLVPRFYRGGERIAGLRGIPIDSDRVPEEWVGSATTVFGETSLGLSALPSGELVRDALRRDPVGWLGADHAARFGGDPALLVKLLDAGERLPVHVHPDGPFARRALGTRYGKTEAWIVVGTSGDDVSVAAGFREDIEPKTIARWVAEQDHDAMLGALNPVPVKPGDAIFIPAGTPHAIGQGAFIVELQEPTDLSVLLEWDGFGISDEQEATLGLGWDAALGCVDLAARDAGALRGPTDGGPVARLLPEAADRFFRAERITAASGEPADVARGFAVLVFLDGAGALTSSESETLPVRRGDTVLVPHAAGGCRLEGDAVAIACRPPDPAVNGGPR